jgi:hypothetical protein
MPWNWNWHSDLDVNTAYKSRFNWEDDAVANSLIGHSDHSARVSTDETSDNSLVSRLFSSQSSSTDRSSLSAIPLSSRIQASLANMIWISIMGGSRDSTVRSDLGWNGDGMFDASRSVC